MVGKAEAEYNQQLDRLEESLLELIIMLRGVDELIRQTTLGSHQPGVRSQLRGDWPPPTTPRLCTTVSNLPAILDARLWKVGTATVKCGMDTVTEKFQVCMASKLPHVVPTRTRTAKLDGRTPALIPPCNAPAIYVGPTT
ncbi:hypothetical protein TIFTF001_016239 [Ficus carica]|uniref:Uncharacterized protein n=1 Tax=Ficus carica TaxID=3494 RepID=A0AA88A7F0_FICCA|nr:hypothetical protein TIFTF001_016239 [Ficus carica]